MTMPITSNRSGAVRHRIHRLFSFDPAEERRRDMLLRTAFLLMVAPFDCRPQPRGPYDEVATGDQTPWQQALSLARNAMAAAIVTGDQSKIDGVLEGASAFAREFEADIASMVPARAEESIVAVALEETHVEGPANESQAQLVAHPSPSTAESAVIPLERQYERLGKLIKGCRRMARRSAPVVG